MLNGILPILYAAVKSIVRKLRPWITRRQFLTLIGSIILVLTGSSWLWVRLRWEQILSLRGEDLVINTVNGVVHDHQVCKGHLPKSHNRTSASNGVKPEQVHKSMGVLIYETMASTANDDQASKYLELAMRQSPTSLHLYNRLIRIYVRQRRYDEIFKILESGRESMRQQLALTGQASSKRLALQRALTEFQFRIGYTKRRAGI